MDKVCLVAHSWKDKSWNQFAINGKVTLKKKYHIKTGHVSKLNS